MAEFKITETGIKDLVVIEPQVFGDSRGFFLESYNKKEFAKNGLYYNFVQDNHSKSEKGVLRGLHFQTQYSQDKLVRATNGSVYDVAVDLRKNSQTFGKYYGLIISAENRKMFLVPKGFAHGFLTLEDNTEFMYKVTEYYHPEFDSGIIWNDSKLAIPWPLEEYGINKKHLKLSTKDSKLQTYMQFTLNLT
ncbi:MAG: dTDP-4-dehydrorhamnose 3,5-epimerase [Victivallales bacterium]|nr:dTDP-4-dehydrorhamnose 3,5-epimerase [Victivallales bacterium]MCF7889254.1 dTDP-4-dehydrorhamnose 3,5-epimerase [Victivallales bacterium]